MVHARERLSAIIERLGGKALANHKISEKEGAESKNQPSPQAFRPNDATLQSLQERFFTLHNMSKSPQIRGLQFESLLADLFNAWHMNARGGFTVTGEQIDGSFQLGDDVSLLEAKWHKAKTDAAALHIFQSKINERPEWTRGLFVSFSGLTDVSLQAFTAKKVILADGMDICEALTRRLSVPDIITKKVRHSSEYRNPFAPVRTLFPF